MKRNLHIGLSILLLSIFLATACKKSLNNSSSNSGLYQHDSIVTAVNTTTHPYPITPVQECIYTANYGDSIVYPQPASGKSGNYYIYPQNTNGLKGTYFSWPAGLILDSNTGAINLTLSQTGERYDIGFIQYGTNDTCISQLIVAGTAYMDSVYVLSQSNISSPPYFNANLSAPSPCQNSLGCQFDYNNYARYQGVTINKQTGFIDLQKTVQTAFGIIPFNGATRNITIYYKLDDNSNDASQQIPVQLIYYNRKADIPPATLAIINSRTNSALKNQLLSKGPSPRPPMIVIVRSF